MLLNPKTYYPYEKDSFGEETVIYEHLDTDRQVTLDRLGNIIDVWSPKTLKVYDVQGKEISTRFNPYLGVSRHRYGYITLFPSVTDDTLRSMEAAGEIHHSTIITIRDFISKGYEITIASGGRLRYVRNQVNGHEIYVLDGTDLSESSPENYPVQDRPFEVQDHTTWTDIFSYSGGTGVLYAEQNLKPGTGEFVPMSDLTLTQLQAVITHIEEASKKYVADYLPVIELPKAGDLDGAYRIWPARDRSYLELIGSAFIENLLEYALRMSAGDSAYLKKQRSLLKKFNDEFSKRICVTKYPVKKAKEDVQEETLPPGLIPEGGYNPRYTPGH